MSARPPDTAVAVTEPESGATTDPRGFFSPARGATLGRFVVLGTLGVGGMGVVLSAYDPELDRRVAVKLLRSDLAFDAAARRDALLAEAKSMARLSHPNVLAVHEVGFADDLGYVVMEQVSGRTLRVWLDEKERGWQEILRVYLAAGAGLAAAHRANVIHRDFKPENVLIDLEERPRVSDFGLAAAAHKPGTVVGTYAYMPPEQAAGKAIDARADQYSFCVALWEALTRERPTASPPLPRDRHGAPAWVYQALARGLASNPDERWPSMGALLVALAPRAPVGRWPWAVGAAAAIGLAAFAFAARPSAVDPCAGAAQRLAGVWDPATKDKVHAAFVATGLPYAEATWARASKRVDDHARRWVDMHVDVCRATRVEGRQSDTMLDVRMACLDRHRAVLGALTSLWARGVDRETLDASIDAAGGLPALAECADARALTDRAQPPAEAAAAQKVAVVRGKLVEVQALTLARRWKEAREKVRAVRLEAEATGWTHLRAEAAFAEGDVMTFLQEPDAEAPLVEAGRLAGAAHDDRLAARSLITLVENLGEDQRKPERGLAVAAAAEAVVARAGDGDDLRGQLLRARGLAHLSANDYEAARLAFTEAHGKFLAALGPSSLDALRAEGDLARVAQEQGDYVTARRLGEEVLERTVQTFGPEHPRVATILNNLGIAAEALDDHDASAAYYRRALAIKEGSLGPESASVALTLNNLAIVEGARHDLAEGRRLLERALAIREKVLGPEHTYVATTLANLSWMLRAQGDRDGALALAQRSLAIRQKNDGPAHPGTAFALSAIGEVLESKGDYPGAREYYQRAYDVRVAGLGKDHALTRRAATKLGEMQAKLGRCAEARALLEGGIQGQAQALGADHSEVARALTGVGRCDLAAGDSAAALGRLQRAMSIFMKLKAEEVERGGARWLLARALWGQGRREEAFAEARTAESELATTADGSLELAEVRSWLASRGTDRKRGK